MQSERGDALQAQDGGGRWQLNLGADDGRVLGYTAAYLDVLEDVTLTGAAPLPASNVAVLGARLTYMRRALDGARLPSSIGAACFDAWPPVGYGPSLEAAGATLRKGDQVTVLLYVRPEREGPFSIGGVELRYDRNGKAFTQQMTDIEVEGMAVRSGVEVPPNRHCGSIVPTWSTPPSPENVCVTRPDTACARTEAD